MTPDSHRGLALALCVVALVAAFATKLPVVDEESYLFLARAIQGHLLHPYDWVRAWQPWHVEPPSYDFAHPPLHWMALALAGRLAPGSLVALRLLVTLPLALVLAASVHRLLGSRGSSRWLWLSSPVVVLGLTSGLMIDLPAAALGTATVAIWRGGQRPGGVARGILWLAGFVLGAAVSVKYPMILLLPVLTMDAWRRRTLWASWPFLLGLLLSWGGVEAWLWATYGHFHPLSVWGAASGIARGPFAGRLLGLASRLGLALLPLPLLASGRGRRYLLLALPPSVLLLFCAWPEELPWLQGLVLLGFATAGVAWAFVAGEAAFRPASRDPDEALLGAWVVCLLLGILFGHNFASGRYLLPLVAPLAGLAALQGRGGRLVVGSVLLQGFLALAMARGDADLARAGADVAEQVAERHPRGRFTGEWAFRWRLEQAGWTVLRPDDALVPGDIVVTPENAVAGPLPLERLQLLEVFGSSIRFPVRLVDVPGNTGYYAETLGAMPVWWRGGSLEEARVYRVERP